MKYMKFLGSRERSSDACHRNSRAGVWAQSKFKTLHKFMRGAYGACCQAGMIFGQAGDLYRTAREAGAYGASVEVS
jgi:hypothetical protein